MKKLTYLLCVSFFIVVFHSCEEEKDTRCDNITCLNGGDCVDGTCNCPTGFTGSLCQTATTGLCAGVTCLNGGTCVSGTCNCPTNYSGDSCQIFTGTTWSTAPFVGYYTGNISCAGGSPFTANLDVTDSSAVPNRLYFDGGTNEAVADYFGDLTSSTNFNIPQQPVMNTLQPGQQINGSGSISGNTITMTYTVTGGITCNLTVTK